MKRYAKIIMIVAMVILVLPVLVQARFNDKEISVGNSIGASSLDAEVISQETELQLSTTAKNMSVGDNVMRSGNIKNVGREKFKYRVAFQETSGSDDALCNILQLEAKQNGAIAYTGNLSKFNHYNTKILNAGDNDNWIFTITLPNGVSSESQNLDCNFKFVWTAWQTDFSEPNKGWVDKEELDNNKIHTGDWTTNNIVLNEFVPNPAGTDNATMPGGEWVELYNKGNKDIDVTGWYLYDNNDDHELKIDKSNSDNNNDIADDGETIVPAKGFLVVYRNGDGDFALNNSGNDSVRLFDGEISNGANLIDNHSYNGRDYISLPSTPGKDNSDNYSGGHANSIPEGKSFVRYPDGVDNWIDPVPTPGKKNDNSNELKKFQDYYRPLCFDDKGDAVCEKEFMEKIKLIPVKENDDKIDEQKVNTGEQKTMDVGLLKRSKENSEIVIFSKDIQKKFEFIKKSDQLIGVNNESSDLFKNNGEEKEESKKVDESKKSVDAEKTDSEKTRISKKKDAVKNDKKIILKESEKKQKKQKKKDNKIQKDKKSDNVIETEKSEVVRNNVDEEGRVKIEAKEEISKKKVKVDEVEYKKSKRLKIKKKESGEEKVKNKENKKDDLKDEKKERIEEVETVKVIKNDKKKNNNSNDEKKEKKKKSDNKNKENNEKDVIVKINKQNLKQKDLKKEKKSFKEDFSKDKKESNVESDNIDSGKK